MIRKHQRVVLFVLIGTLGLVPAARAAEPDVKPDRVGLAAEPPAEGPVIKTEHGYLVPYTTKIPGTDVEFEMVPIPSGKFLMGSPEDETDRKPDEGPQFEARIEPFWMGKYEVTWGEYMRYMALYDVFKELDALRTFVAELKNNEEQTKAGDAIAALLDKHAVLRAYIERRANLDRHGADAITAPTKLYDPSFTFENGQRPRQPAVTMTQYAARQYTRWLSALTGHVYRLPTEAEWEYACRAGTTTAWHFGDDVDDLDSYGWYFDNADDTTHDVGKKKPNPWGLYDMHGNVAEWVLDEYHEQAYKPFAGRSVGSWEAVVWPKKLFPRVIRGGSWDDDADRLRSAARFKSHDTDWKAEDPNRPLSPWWYTNDPSRAVGFRVVRQLGAPTDEQRHKFWQPDVPEVVFDVEERLREGRGALEVVDPTLPQVIEVLQEVKKLRAALEAK